MKKRYLISFLVFSILFISACGRIQSSEKQIENNSWSVLNSGDMIVSQESLQNPEIIIENATWSVIDSGNRDWIYYKDVLWYRYTYYYKDLWLEVISSDKENIFLNRFTGEVFSRSWNMIYFGSGPDMESIIVHEKDPNVSLEDEVFNKYIIEWCEVYTWFLSDDTRGLSWFYYVNLYNRSLEVDSCVITKGNIELNFIVDSKNPGKYLEISGWGDCGPWPCSVFWEIKFK